MDRKGIQRGRVCTLPCRYKVTRSVHAHLFPNSRSIEAGEMAAASAWSSSNFFHDVVGFLGRKCHSEKGSLKSCICVADSPFSRSSSTQLCLVPTFQSDFILSLGSSIPSDLSLFIQTSARYCHSLNPIAQIKQRLPANKNFFLYLLRTVGHESPSHRSWIDCQGRCEWYRDDCRCWW